MFYCWLFCFVLFCFCYRVTRISYVGINILYMCMQFFLLCLNCTIHLKIKIKVSLSNEFVFLRYFYVVRENKCAFFSSRCIKGLFCSDVLLNSSTRGNNFVHWGEKKNWGWMGDRAQTNLLLGNALYKLQKKSREIQLPLPGCLFTVLSYDTIT